MCEIRLKLTIKILERPYQCHSVDLIVNLEMISHIVLVFTLLTLNKET